MLPCRVFSRSAGLPWRSRFVYQKLGPRERSVHGLGAYGTGIAIFGVATLVRALHRVPEAATNVRPVRAVSRGTNRRIFDLFRASP